MSETVEIKNSALTKAHVRWPIITEEDKKAVLTVLDRGVFSGPFAPEVQALEKEFSSYVGSKYCLATNSGTSALHIGLAALGIGPGDEVIVPAFTFVATAMAVLHQNAIPIFVDIEPVSFGMDPKQLEAAITPLTRAIIPVHMHGTPCNLEEILKIAKRYKIPVLEDACQAHGAIYQDKKVGSIGTLAAFSLQSSKNLSCGEGGLLVSGDENLILRANRVRMFGEDIKPHDALQYRIDRPLDADRAYDSVTVGWMYRTTEMSAALARSQLKNLDYWNENARKNAAYLSKTLSKLPGVEVPKVPDDRISVFHKYRVCLDATKMGIDVLSKTVRDVMVSALRKEGVDAVLWQTQPVPGQTVFKEKIGFGKGCPWELGLPVNYDLMQYPETIKLLDRSLCLFSHTFPIACQPMEICQAYAEIFANIWNSIDRILPKQ